MRRRTMAEAAKTSKEITAGIEARLKAERLSGSEPKPKILRAVPSASELHKPVGERWNAVQRIDTGLIAGRIGPTSKGLVVFNPDGTAYTLTAQALREIADLIDLHGVELAT